MKDCNYSKNNKCKICKKLITNNAVYCNSCAQKGEYNSNFIDGRVLKQHYCKDCGKEICYHTWKYGTKKCRKCENSGLNHHGYIDGRSLRDYYCIDCGEEISVKSGLYGQGKCPSCANKKENNPNWNNGSSFEPYPLGWNKTFKEQIRYRDHYICQICGCPEVECNRKLHVHHIDYNKENIDPKNLISLCQSCHMKTNFNRDYWYAYFRYVMERILKKEVKHNGN